MLQGFSGVDLSRIGILRNALGHVGWGRFVFLVQYMLVMWRTTHFIPQEIIFGALLENGEFLNVDLFCRVSFHARDACLFLSQHLFGCCCFYF